jgi:hypothetical protein
LDKIKKSSPQGKDFLKNASEGLRLFVFGLYALGANFRFFSINLFCLDID